MRPGAGSSLALSSAGLAAVVFASSRWVVGVEYIGATVVLQSGPRCSECGHGPNLCSSNTGVLESVSVMHSGGGGNWDIRIGPWPNREFHTGSSV
jgi:hypothetical protein